jgi:putative NADH-flavin reductase
MKLIIFGSTGGTGRELVKQALEQNHDVTAFARTPSKLDDLKHERLNIIQGDVLDAGQVEEAVSGHDAVLSAIGGGPKQKTIRQDGTRHIIGAMEKSGVRRLISESSYGVGDSREALPFITRLILVHLFLKNAFADHEKQEEIIRQSDLDWTIVRPVYLTNGPHTGVYQHGFANKDRKITGKISRADVADFMLKQVKDDTYLKATPGLSY